MRFPVASKPLLRPEIVLLGRCIGEKVDFEVGMLNYGLSRYAAR